MDFRLMIYPCAPPGPRITRLPFSELVVAVLFVSVGARGMMAGTVKVGVGTVDRVFHLGIVTEVIPGVSQGDVNGRIPIA